MDTHLVYQVVFNETELHLEKAENLARLPVRKYLRPSRYFLSSRMSDKEFEPADKARPLGELTKWIGEQTSTFRPLRRFDFVHVMSGTKSKMVTATWTLTSQDDAALGFLFSADNWLRSTNKKVSDWRLLAPDWAQLIPLK